MDGERDMPGPDLRCYYHPGVEATDQCDRCGDYLCARCATLHNEQHLCPECLERLTYIALGMTGKVANVLNAVGWISVAVAVLGMTLRPQYLLDKLIVASAIGIVVACFTGGFVFSLLKRKCEDLPVRTLRNAITLSSLSILSYAILTCLAFLAGFPDDETLLGDLLAAAGSVISMVLCVAAVVTGVKAALRRVKLIWGVVLALLPLLLTWVSMMILSKVDFE